LQQGQQGCDCDSLDSECSTVSSSHELLPLLLLNEFLYKHALGEQHFAVNLTPTNGDPLRLTRTNGVVPGTKTLVAFNEFKIALREYEGVISGGGGASKEPRQRLYTALLEGVACDAFDNETRKKRTLV